MPAKTNFNPEKIRQRKRAIGIVAIVLLLVITVLAILLHTSFIVWVLADLIVAGVANLLLRRVPSGVVAARKQSKKAGGPNTPVDYSTKPQTVGTMICRTCGSENPQVAEFCLRCGARTKTDDKTQIY
jgi:ribosomal protein L40E